MDKVANFPVSKEISYQLEMLFLDKKMNGFLRKQKLKTVKPRNQGKKENQTRKHKLPNRPTLPLCCQSKNPKYFDSWATFNAKAGVEIYNNWL